MNHDPNVCKDDTKVSPELLEQITDLHKDINSYEYELNSVDQDIPRVLNEIRSSCNHVIFSQEDRKWRAVKYLFKNLARVNGCKETLNWFNLHPKYLSMIKNTPEDQSFNWLGNIVWYGGVSFVFLLCAKGLYSTIQMINK